MPITIVYGSQRKTATFNPTPGLTLSALVQQAVAKFNLPKEGREYELIYQNKPVDVSLPFRLSKIPQTATLELQTKKKNTKKIQPCKIALQLPTGKRVTGEFPSSASLWDILLHFQLEAGLNLTIDKEKAYFEPEIMFLQRKFKKFSELKNSSLSSISASGGLLRLSVTPSGKSLGQIMEASPDFPVPSPPSTPSDSIVEEILPPLSSSTSQPLPDLTAEASSPNPAVETRQEAKLEERESKTAEKMEIVENVAQSDTKAEKMDIETGKENIEKENAKDAVMEDAGADLKRSEERKGEASLALEKPKRTIEKKQNEKKAEKKSKWEVELEPMVVPEREIKFYERPVAKPKLPGILLSLLFLLLKKKFFLFDSD